MKQARVLVEQQRRDLMGLFLVLIPTQHQVLRRPASSHRLSVSANQFLWSGGAPDNHADGQASYEAFFSYSVIIIPFNVLLQTALRAGTQGSNNHPAVPH